MEEKRVIGKGRKEGRVDEKGDHRERISSCGGCASCGQKDIMVEGPLET